MQVARTLPRQSFRTREDPATVSHKQANATKTSPWLGEPPVMLAANGPQGASGKQHLRVIPEQTLPKTSQDAAGASAEVGCFRRKVM